jgi:heme/copper-type cytochrome/quinol oxidase subunit 3
MVSIETEKPRHGELSNGMLGFILFLASEVMFFGGLFGRNRRTKGGVAAGTAEHTER